MSDLVTLGAPQCLERASTPSDSPELNPVSTVQPTLGDLSVAAKPGLDTAQATLNSLDAGNPVELDFGTQIEDKPLKVVEHTGSSPRETYIEKTWANTDRELTWSDGRRYTDKPDGKGGRDIQMRAPNVYENFDEHVTPKGPGSADVTRSGPNPENNYTSSRTPTAFTKTWQDGRTLNVRLESDGYVHSTYKGYGPVDSFTSVTYSDGTRRYDYFNKAGYIKYPDGRIREW